MSNDLISRDALINALEATQYNDFDDLSRTEDLIDNAPTVDAIPNTEGYEMYNKGYVQGYERGKAEAIPQGEWIDERNDGGACLAICSKCRTLEITGCFCRTCGSNNTDSFMKLFNCGASMQKGGAENG